jgi:Cu/Ag efflux protein CusF
MKRTLVVMIALLAMVAFVSGVMAQAPGKTAKPKAEEPKKMRFNGAVVGYEAGKMIKVKRSSGTEMTFSITRDTQMEGEVKEGAKVSVEYKKVHDKMVTSSISVFPERKARPNSTPGKEAGEVPEKK